MRACMCLMWAEFRDGDTIHILHELVANQYPIKIYSKALTGNINCLIENKLGQNGMDCIYLFKKENAYCLLISELKSL